MINKNLDDQEFFILCPPPNMTGNLHIGHALTFSIQDFIVRINRNFLNKKSFLLAGYDHGGLSSEKAASKAKNLSEDRSIRFNQIKEFTIESKNNIAYQFKKLNLLIIDKYTKFTMDDDHYKLVEDAFIKLYKDGYILRTVGLVNFDTKLKTAISDLEISRKMINSKIYKIYYKISNSHEILEVQTTRPETIFADMALCVNPLDTRYQHLKNQKAIIPILNKEIPIIFDEYVDINFGSGVLKITPAHDINDYKLWLKNFKNTNNIINIINTDGNLILNHITNNENVLKYHNQNIANARQMIVNDLQCEFSDISQNIPIGEKSEAPIEYLLLEQWFFNVEKASKMALKKINELPIYPEIWRNTYKSWLENINPLWCISRSTVWGHEIPAYFNKNGDCKVQKESPGDGWFKKNEILDTWFSSALWPLSYKYSFDKYPCDVLVTGYDIIFFWVARMVMVSLLLDNSMPFKNVYLHRLVTDKEGKKMSKTVGNVIDPMDIINTYGSDTLRLALLKTLSPCGKIRISEELLEEAKSIITKIKNFKVYLSIDLKDKNSKNGDDLIIKYFRFKTFELEYKLKEYLETYEIHLIVHHIIEFLYEICCWFLEFSKTRPGLIDFLTITYNKICLLLGAMIPETCDVLENQMKYEYEQKCETVEKIECLKNVITEIRSYKKLDIDVYIEDCDFSDIILKMTNCKIGNHGKYKNFKGYNLYLDNIKIDVVQKKIKNINEEIEKIELFLSKTGDDTPIEVIKEKENRNIFLKKEVKILSELI